MGMTRMTTTTTTTTTRKVTMTTTTMTTTTTTTTTMRATRRRRRMTMTMTTRTSHVPRAARVHNSTTRHQASRALTTVTLPPSPLSLVNRSCVVLIYGEEVWCTPGSGTDTLKINVTKLRG